LWPHILKRGIELPANLALCVIRNADPAWLCDALKAGRNVNAVAIDVIVVEDDVADVNADAKLDPSLPGHIDIFDGDPPLDLHRAARRIDGTGELHQHTVASRFHDATAMQCDRGVHQRLPEGLKLGQRPFLVPAHQKAITGNICRQNRRQSPFHSFLSQERPHT
jgi:hypothetical protein